MSPGSSPAKEDGQRVQAWTSPSSWDTVGGGDSGHCLRLSLEKEVRAGIWGQVTGVRDGRQGYCHPQRSPQPKDRDGDLASWERPVVSVHPDCHTRVQPGDIGVIRAQCGDRGSHEDPRGQLPLSPRHAL
jgi:hypothetical protein